MGTTPDILPKLIVNLDRHLIFPLLEFEADKDGNNHISIVKAIYELMRGTSMTDYVASLWQELNQNENLPEKFAEERAAVLQRAESLAGDTAKLDDLLSDDAVISNLRSDKLANQKYLETTHGVRDVDIDKLYEFGRFQYSCGSYANAAQSLDRFRILSTDNDKVHSATWGKLVCDILSTEWDMVTEDINKVRELIETKLFNNPLAQLQHRTSLIHYMLFPLFNNMAGREHILETLLTPAFINTIQTHCPWILRYLTAAVMTSTGRIQNVGLYQRQLKDLVRIIKQEGYDYQDPVTDLIKTLYLDYDFEAAQLILARADDIIKHDFFLSNSADSFMDAARHLISENYCKIHQSIDIQELSARLGLGSDEGERWMVNLIRDTRMDGKLDYKRGIVSMNHPANSLYQQVREYY